MWKNLEKKSRESSDELEEHLVEHSPKLTKKCYLDQQSITFKDIHFLYMAKIMKMNLFFFLIRSKKKKKRPKQSALAFHVLYTVIVPL